MIRSKKGGILIYILGMIALLSIIVTEFLLEAAAEIRYRSQVTHRDDLKILAYSALETTVAVLAEVKAIDKKLYSPEQNWGKPLAYAKFAVPKDYTISVKIRDETGKLSIYEEDLKTFGDLMQEMGVSYEQITNLKSELKTWLSEKKDPWQKPKLKPDEKLKGKKPGGEKEKEVKPNPNEQPKPNEESKSDEKPKEKDKDEKKKKEQRIIYNLLQLKEIPAFERVFFDAKNNPNEKFKLLKDSISILHKGPLNINTAPDLIKKVILGDLALNPRTNGKSYFRSMKELGFEGESAKQLEKVIGFNARVLDVDIQVERGTVKYYLSAIVDFGDKSDDPDKPKDSDKAKDADPLKDPNKPKDLKDAKNKENKGDFTFLALTEDGTFDK